jgi:Arc/MetJ-type ribon-helix-helix transcriptional regulator
MPNQRAEGQKLLTVPASTDFINDIDKNLKRVGYANRSQFIRDAIVEKMARAGVELPKELTLPPARTRPDGKYPEHRPDNYVLNEKPNSKIKAAKADRVSAATNRVLARRKSVSE